MACKIERVPTPVGLVVLRVSGRIEGVHVDILKRLIVSEQGSIAGVALDLTETTVVSIGAIRMLAAAEAEGIELLNCPNYIRQWISQDLERDRLPDTDRQTRIEHRRGRS